MYFEHRCYSNPLMGSGFDERCGSCIPYSRVWPSSFKTWVYKHPIWGCELIKDARYSRKYRINSTITYILQVAMSWFMNIIMSITQASAQMVLLMLTRLSCHIEKPIAQMWIQHIILSTKGAEGSLHHTIPFISIPFILFRQSSQLYLVVDIYFQLLTKIRGKISHNFNLYLKYVQNGVLCRVCNIYM